jgi:hypothetical protein
MHEQSSKVIEANQQQTSLLNTIITPYGGCAIPLQGNKICRECITHDVVGADLSYFHFQDVEAKGIKISKCKFQHCVFERCYFRNITFEDCDFTGARFIDSNLRGSILITCQLEYTFYKTTVLDRAQFAANLPIWENVRAEVARSLRTNSYGLGDTEGVNYFIIVEMNGTLEHWWKAFLQKESYYKKKYPGFWRIQALGRYTFYYVDRLLWGHGERPLRILCNILFLLFASAIGLTLASSPSIGNLQVGFLVHRFLASLRSVSWIFLGAPIPVTQIPSILILLLVAMRYISIALFVGILSKRFSQR